MTARAVRVLFAALAALVVVLLGTPAAAGPAPRPPAHTVPADTMPAYGGPVWAGVLAQPVIPTPPVRPTGPAGSVTVDVGGTTPGTSMVLLLGLTMLSVAPALLLLCSSFTKIFVVLSISRNALGLTTVPPNQVLAGLALFLSMFIMGPILSEMNTKGVQPFISGEKTQSQALTDGVQPLRQFMMEHTRPDEIALLTKVADQPRPAKPEDVPLTTLIPAFVLSELRAAFIIGFVVYVPFLVVDMVVSASLMSLGMMMLPPVTVSLPFKLLLFVLVDGWGLIITALVASY